MRINLNLPKKNGLFITGTDTSVGKTLIAGAIAKILTDKGLKVGVFKPVATGCISHWEGLVSRDSEFLACCANSNLRLTVINPVAYVTAAAPIVSAAEEHRPIDFKKIAIVYDEICRNCDIVIVEGIGGIRVPLTDQFDLRDLAAEFGLPVVIVSRPHLGTINHTLMTIDSVRAANLKIAGVVINGYDSLQSTIAEETAGQVISQCGNVAILADVPFDETASVEELKLGEVIIPSLAEVDWVNLAKH
jgi:dethiobiotin synthetase